MHRINSFFTSLGLLAIMGLLTLPLAAQAPCQGVTTLVGSPEDQLMLAYNGADKPEEQIAALEKYSQGHADPKFIPCVNEYFTTVYLKTGDYQKAIKSGERALAVNYHSLNLIVNLLKAYVATGNPSPDAFSLIAKVPEQMKTESNLTKPQNVSDEQWIRMQHDEDEAIKQDRAYVEYAFFVLLPRVRDGAKRVQYLNDFAQSYPDTTNKSQVAYNYFLAYELAGNSAKAEEWGEKSIAADPNYIEALNALAYHYALASGTHFDKAAKYARKAASLVSTMKKTEGVSDRDFAGFKNLQLGMARLTQGYVLLKAAEADRKVAPAIDQLKAASATLGSHPELEGEALYFLAVAYELQWPVPNHHLADAALTKGSSIPSRWQGQTQNMLEKVQARERRGE